MTDQKHRPKNDEYRPGDLVYAVQHPGTECIKIGKSGNFNARFTGLRSYFGALRVLGVMDGYTHEERSAHALLKASALPSMGAFRKTVDAPSDWFYSTDEVKNFIRDNMRPYEKRIRISRQYTSNRAPAGELVLCWLLSKVGEPLTFFNHVNDLEWIAVYQVADNNDRTIYKRMQSCYWDTAHWFWHGDKFVFHITNSNVYYAPELDNRDRKAAIELGFPTDELAA